MALHRTDTVQTEAGRSVSFEMCVASLFEGETRDAIIGLKYRNERRLARDLALLLLPVVPSGAELLTWAPTAAKRRMARGVGGALDPGAAGRCRPLGLRCLAGLDCRRRPGWWGVGRRRGVRGDRSEEHTSELQSH